MCPRFINVSLSVAAKKKKRNSQCLSITEGLNKCGTFFFMVCHTTVKNHTLDVLN